MDKVNYRETQLWADTKELAVATYRHTSTWTEDGKAVATEIQQLTRTLARAVPNAFKKPGMSGNINLKMAVGNFAELDALLEIALALGFADDAVVAELRRLAEPVENKLRELNKEAKKYAAEAMAKRMSRFSPIADEDEDF